MDSLALMILIAAALLGLLTTVLIDFRALFQLRAFGGSGFTFALSA